MLARIMICLMFWLCKYERVIINYFNLFQAEDFGRKVAADLSQPWNCSDGNIWDVD